LEELKEGRKKADIRWKTANIIVRTAYEKKYAIVLKKPGEHVANNMIKKIKSRQLHHRYSRQASRASKKLSRRKLESTVSQ